MRALESAVDAQPTIVVLIGLPRSGTTWVGKILDSHPETEYRHEPDSARRLPTLPFAPDVAQWTEHASTIRTFAATLDSIRDVRTAGKLPLFRKQYDLGGGYLVRKAAVALARLAGAHAHRISIPSLARKGARRVLVWKSINSTARLGVLARALPDAHFVHIVRHPCGHADSVLRGLAGRHMSAPQWEDLDVLRTLMATEPARRYGITVQAMQRLSPASRDAWLWAVQNEKALDDTSGCANVTHVRYEDFCATPQPAARMLFASARLAWCRQTEIFLERSTSVHSRSYYALFKDPMQAAHAWRRNLDTRTVNEVTSIVSTTGAWHWYKNTRLAQGGGHVAVVPGAAANVARSC
jgi:hypothetical protein